MIADSSRRLRRWLVGAALAIAALWPATLQGQAPASPEAVRFAVIGDMGTGSRRQIETARRLAAARDRFHYTFVITVGDNIYGGEKPDDFKKKFETIEGDTMSFEVISRTGTTVDSGTVPRAAAKSMSQ